MANTRYAKRNPKTKKPCCPCMTEANNKVKEAMGDDYHKLHKYKSEDGPWRVVWMNAYKECIEKCPEEAIERKRRLIQRAFRSYVA